MPENSELSFSYISSIPFVWYAKFPTAIGSSILVLGIIVMIASVTDVKFSFKYVIEEKEMLLGDHQDKS